MPWLIPYSRGLADTEPSIRREMAIGAEMTAKSGLPAKAPFVVLLGLGPGSGGITYESARD